MTAKHDKISATVHAATRQTLLELFIKYDGKNDQGAVIAGMAAGLAEVLWIGRRSDLTREAAKKMWSGLGNDFIDQAANAELAESN